MRRVSRMTFLLLATCVLTSLVLTTPAKATLKKISSNNICYHLENEGGYYHQGVILLDFKSSGMKIKTEAGQVKFYNVQGAIGIQGSMSGQEPVSGAAYLDLVDGGAEGYFTGSYPGNFTHCYFFISDEGSFKINCKTENELSTYGYTATEVNCDEYVID